MGFIDAVGELFEVTSASGRATDGSKGAYWCDDCGERIRDVDVDGGTPPDCPSCDEPMRFERSMGSSCAC